MKTYKAIVSPHLTHQNGEKRFVVVSKETGEVLDNNKGEGFRTENKALTHFELKTYGKVV